MLNGKKNAKKKINKREKNYECCSAKHRRKNLNETKETTQKKNELK